MFNYLNKRRKKGQSAVEYAILIIIVIGALLSIQVYIKRGIQGRMKQATDDIGDQFSPGNTNVLRKVKTNSFVEQKNFAGEQSTVDLVNSTTTETLNSKILNVTQEFWRR